MGEIADAMLSGLFCQCCGEVFDDMDEPGYPRMCEACDPPRKPNLAKLSQAARRLNKRRRNKRTPAHD